MERTYFIYRHIRLDTGVPFYVGKGVTTPDAKSWEWEYRRAFYGTEKRNQYWKRITSKTDYEVEIMFETNNPKIIDGKEKEFIKLYGRKNVGGTLCNLTDGGDGWSNPPQDCIDRAVKKRTENGTYKNVSDKNSTPIYIYDLHGKFVREFKSIREVKEVTFIHVTTVWEYIKTKRSIYGYVLSKHKNEKGIDVSEYKITKPTNIPVLKMRWDETPIELYKSRTSLININGGSYTGLDTALRLGTEYYGFYWKEVDILDIQHYINHGAKYIGYYS